ncbi:uncharacterized protein LOC110735623 [Chenopodium quinoa]|uniref:uncharacterized protein LOC110735623 n=1 Tax=Chenopodium quinoa TaxID=63459 RepID=UPI000B76F1B0|nr:uncharacterized protein LOC110735623 [Chenopodium quinoa]
MKNIIKKKEDQFIQSQKGALDKFFLKVPQSSENPIDSELLDENNVGGDNVNVDNDNVDANNANVNVDDNNINVEQEDVNLNNVDDFEQNVEENSDHYIHNVKENDFVSHDIYDPRIWGALDQKSIDILAINGLKRNLTIVKGPKTKYLGDLLQICTLDICLMVKHFLGKNNLAFRGKHERLYQSSNGNFLGLIEMLAEFDPVIIEHVLRMELFIIIILAMIFGMNCHQEQMTLILRCVDKCSNCYKVTEFFIEFLQVNDTTGLGLFKVLENVLIAHDLDIDNIKGQGYDNGSNMKENVKGLTLKSLSVTRWESRVESIKAIRFQITEIHEALLEVVDADNDHKLQSEARSLANNELGSYEFLLATIIWYEMLCVVNFVCKQLQSQDMLIDIAISEIKGLISFF